MMTKNIKLIYKIIIQKYIIKVIIVLATSKKLTIKGVEGMKKKSILALVLAVATLLGGCGSPAAAGGTDTPAKDSGAADGSLAGSEAKESEGTVKETETKSDEPMELSCMVDLSTENAVIPDSLLVKQIEEELNVKFNFVPKPTGSQDDIRKAINLQIASGDFPDFIADVKFADYYAYAKQGLLAEIPVDMIKSEAPTLTAWIENNLYAESSWDYYAIDGKNYIVPSIWTIGPAFATMVVRQDWLEEVGVNEIPDTLEELEDALIKIKEAKNIYPLTGTASNIKPVYQSIFGAYGLYPHLFTAKDGKVVYGAVDPKAREALEVAHRWYEEGLIDPEFVINDEKMKREKWTAEKAAVMDGAFYHAITEEAYWGGKYYDPLIEKNPNAKVVTMAPPAGPDGERGITQDNPIVNAGVVFAKRLEDEPEKLAKYLQICEYMLKEQKKLTVGTEGETYKLDENGNTEWIPPYDDLQKRREYGLGSGSKVIPGFVDYDVDFELKPKQFADEREAAISNCIGQYDILGPAPRPVYQEKKEALDRIAYKNMIDFITGERDISEFDAFVEEWNAAGGTQVLEEAQEYFERFGLNNVNWGEK